MGGCPFFMPIISENVYQSLLPNLASDWDPGAAVAWPDEPAGRQAVKAVAWKGRASGALTG